MHSRNFGANETLTVGVDFGTSAVRALVLNAETGEEIGQSVAGFPHWDRGDYCDESRSVYRQHPQESLDALKDAVSKVVGQLSQTKRAHIAGLTIDTTGSTPLPLDADARPLAMRREFATEPDAMCNLWKDHSSADSAQLINSVLTNQYAQQDYLAFCGGAYSPEWFWAKILHVARNTPGVADAAATWVEHCDWLAAELTGVTKPDDVIRSRCGAAHKALWNSAFGGYPPSDVFDAVHPYLGRLRRELPEDTITAEKAAGVLTDNWARELGLPSGVVVGVGLFDAHAGAVGAGARRGRIVKVIGTSSADMFVASPQEMTVNPVPGVESQAEGSIIPGMIGIEAGQSAFGDVFAWLARLLSFGEDGGNTQNGNSTTRIIGRLEELAAKRGVKESSPVALDWFNGRRAPFPNSNIAGAVAGLNLGVDAVELYATLVRSVAFGTRAIHEHLLDHHIPVETVAAVGGIPKKSSYIMQTLSDCIERPIEVCDTEVASARGSAILAAVACGHEAEVNGAVERLASPVARSYKPNPASREVLRKLYKRYKTVGKALDASYPQ